MAARGQASLQRRLQSSQEAQCRQAVLVRKLQAKGRQYRAELEQQLEAGGGFLPGRWEATGDHRLEKALLQLEEERQRCEGLAEVNAVLREQLEQANAVNSALREDVGKLTADWVRAREELERKESEWRKERELYDNYVRDGRNRLLSLWCQVVTFHRRFLEMKTATDRDLSELKAEQMRLSGAILVTCSCLNSGEQVCESLSLGRPVQAEQQGEQEIRPKSLEVACSQDKGDLEEELQDRVTELSALLGQCQKQNEEKEKTMKTLNNSVEIPGRALAEVSEEKELLAQEKAALEERLAAMERDRQGLSEQLAEARSVKETLESSLFEAQQHLRQLEIARSQLEIQLQTVTQAKEAVQGVLKCLQCELEAERSLTRQERENMGQELLRKEQQYDDALRLQQTEHEVELNKLLQDLASEREGRHSDLREVLEQWEEEKAEADREHEKKLFDMKQQVAALQAQQEEERTRVENAKQELLLEKEREKDAVLEMLLQTQGELTEACQQLRQLRQEVEEQQEKEQNIAEELQAELQEAQGEITAVEKRHEEEIQTIREEMNILLQQREALQKQVEELTSQLAASEESVKKGAVTLHQEVASLTRKLESAQKQRKDVLHKRDRLQAVKEKLVWEVKLLRESVTASETRAHTATDVNHCLEQELQATLCVLKLKNEEVEAQWEKIQMLQRDAAEVEALQETLTHVTAILTEREGEMKLQQERMRMLEKQKEMHKTTLDQVVKDITEKNQKIQSQQEQIRDLEKQREGQRTAVSQMRQELEERDREIQLQEGKIMSSASQVRNLLVDLDCVKADLREKNVELVSLTQQMHELEMEREEVKSLRASLEHVRAVLRDTESERDSQRDQLRLLQLYKEQQEGHLQELHDKIEKMALSLSEEDQGFESQHKQTQEAEEAMAMQLRTVREQLQQTLETLKEKDRLLDIQKEQARSYEEKTEARMNVLQRDLEHTEAILKEKDFTIESQKELLETFHKREQDSEQQKAILQHLEVALQEHEQEMLSLQSLISERDTEWFHLQQATAEREQLSWLSEKRLLSQWLEHLLQAVARLECEKVELKQLIAELRRTLEEVERERRRLKRYFKRRSQPDACGLSLSDQHKVPASRQDSSHACCRCPLAELWNQLTVALASYQSSGDLRQCQSLQPSGSRYSRSCCCAVLITIAISGCVRGLGTARTFVVSVCECCTFQLLNPVVSFDRGLGRSSSRQTSLPHTFMGLAESTAEATKLYPRDAFSRKPRCLKFCCCRLPARAWEGFSGSQAQLHNSALIITESRSGPSLPSAVVVPSLREKRVRKKEFAPFSRASCRVFELDPNSTVLRYLVEAVALGLRKKHWCARKKLELLRIWVQFWVTLGTCPFPFHKDKVFVSLLQMQMQLAEEQRYQQDGVECCAKTMQELSHLHQELSCSLAAVVREPKAAVLEAETQKLDRSLNDLSLRLEEQLRHHGDSSTTCMSSQKKKPVHTRAQDKEQKPPPSAQKAPVLSRMICFLRGCCDSRPEAQLGGRQQGTSNKAEPFHRQSEPLSAQAAPVHGHTDLGDLTFVVKELPGPRLQDPIHVCLLFILDWNCCCAGSRGLKLELFAATIWNSINSKFLVPDLGKGFCLRKRGKDQKTDIGIEMYVYFMKSRSGTRWSKTLEQDAVAAASPPRQHRQRGSTPARHRQRGAGRDPLPRAGPSELGSPAPRPGSRSRPARPGRGAAPAAGPVRRRARLASGAMAARGQASLQRRLQSSQEAQCRQAVLVRKLQAKGRQYRAELEQQLEAGGGFLPGRWEATGDHRLEKALLQLEEERQRCEGLAEVNAVLREQLEQANAVNSALREDVGKLTADWVRAREELERKESEWRKERELYDNYIRDGRNRLLSLWCQVVTFHRRFLEMKTATDRDLSELKAEQMRLSGAILVTCSCLNSGEQVCESLSLGRPVQAEQQGEQEISPKSLEVACSQDKGDLEEELQDRVTELSALLGQCQKQNEEKEKTMKTLNNSVEIPGRALAEVSEEKELLAQEKAALEERLAAMERDRQGLSEQLAEARSVKETLESSLFEAQQHLRQLEIARSQLEIQLQTVTQAKEAVQGVLKCLQCELEAERSLTRQERENMGQELLRKEQQYDDALRLQQTEHEVELNKLLQDLASEREGRHSDLREVLEQWEEEKAEADREHEKKLFDMKQQVAALQAQQEEERTRVENAKQELLLEKEREKDAVLEMLLQTRGELTEACQQLRQLRQEVEEQQEKEQNIAEELQAELQEAQGEIMAVEKRHEEEIQTIREEMNILLQQREALQKQVEELTSQLAASEESVKKGAVTLHQEVASLTRKLESAQKQRKDVLHKRDRLQAVKEKLVWEVKLLRESVTASETRAHTATDVNHCLEQELQATLCVLKLKNEEVEAQWEKIQMLQRDAAEVEALQETLTHVTAILTEREGEMKLQQERMRMLEKQKEMHKTTLDQVVKDITEKNEKIQSQQEQIRDLEKQREGQRTAVSQMRQELEERDREIQLQEGKIMSSASQVRNLLVDLDCVKADLREKNVELVSLTQQMHELEMEREEVKSLRASLEHVRAVLRDTESERDSQRDQLRLLQLYKEQQEGHLQELHDKIEKMALSLSEEDQGFESQHKQTQEAEEAMAMQLRTVREQLQQTLETLEEKDRLLDIQKEQARSYEEKTEARMNVLQRDLEHTEAILKEKDFTIESQKELLETFHKREQDSEQQKAILQHLEVALQEHEQEMLSLQSLISERDTEWFHLQQATAEREQLSWLSEKRLLSQWLEHLLQAVARLECEKVELKQLIAELRRTLEEVERERRRLKRYFKRRSQPDACGLSLSDQHKVPASRQDSSHACCRCPLAELWNQLTVALASYQSSGDLRQCQSLQPSGSRYSRSCCCAVLITIAISGCRSWQEQQSPDFPSTYFYGSGTAGSP
ncbi:uncharacterized protein O9250_009185 [Rhynochetos jubatus]